MNSSLFTLVSQPFFTQQKSSLLAAPGHLDWQSGRAEGIRGTPLRSWKWCSLASFLLSASPTAKQSLSPRLSVTAEYPKRTLYEESLLCSINGEEINIFEGNSLGLFLMSAFREDGLYTRSFYSVPQSYTKVFSATGFTEELCVCTGQRFLPGCKHIKTSKILTRQQATLTTPLQESRPSLQVKAASLL